MRKMGTGCGLLLVVCLAGCTNLANSSVAGGGCERSTTYGIEFAVLGFELDFGLVARCETNEDAD